MRHPWTPQLHQLQLRAAWKYSTVSVQVLQVVLAVGQATRLRGQVQWVVAAEAAKQELAAAMQLISSKVEPSPRWVPHTIAVHDVVHSGVACRVSCRLPA